MTGNDQPASDLFQEDDIVAFIGDSITQQAYYVNPIRLYYLTRFPGRRMELLNYGLAGNIVADGIKRLDYEIWEKAPNKAVIMFGMNDVGSQQLYRNKENTQDILEKRQITFANYQTNMNKLVSALRSKNVGITLMTPSIYDETAQLELDTIPGITNALKMMSQIVRDTAAAHALDLVELNEPMLQLTAEAQTTNPEFTLIGDDRVHPGEVGGLIMAYLFLKQQGAPSEVATLAIDASTWKVEHAANCEGTHLQVVDGQVSFTYKPLAFPYPMEQGGPYAAGNQIVPLTKDLNQETLKVSGLAVGTYSVEMDGMGAGQYSSEQLAQGINLAIQMPRQIDANRIADEHARLCKLEYDLRQVKLAEKRLAIGGLFPLYENLPLEQIKAIVASKLAEPIGDDLMKSLQWYFRAKQKEPETQKQFEAAMRSIFSKTALKSYEVLIKKLPERGSLTDSPVS